MVDTNLNGLSLKGSMKLGFFLFLADVTDFLGYIRTNITNKNHEPFNTPAIFRLYHLCSLTAVFMSASLS